MIDFSKSPVLRSFPKAAVPPAVAEERLVRVLEARDDVLRASQTALLGQDVEVLVDEAHDSGIVGRTAMDAPEVDLVAHAPGIAARVGDRHSLRVVEIGEEFDLICASGAPA